MFVQGGKSRRYFFRLGISALAFALLPNQIGFQDLGALIARQPAVGQRWRAHIVSAPPGTIHATMFRVPRLIGAIPKPPLYAVASVSPNEIAAALGRDPLGELKGPLQFPSVNRTNTRDSLTARPRKPLPPLPPTLDELVPSVETEAPFAAVVAAVEAMRPPRFERYDDYELPVAPDQVSRTPDVDLPYVDLPPTDFAKAAQPEEAPGGQARLYFGVDPIGAVREAIAPWRPGEAPQIVAPPPADPDIKLSALVPPKDAVAENAGESAAPKGEVTGPSQRPMSPAERLGLSGTSRAKAEKCLANAVYFESRGEPVRGQIAVAQVVMNRVFTPFYPKTVCEVVYQNAHRHNSCQFTFACDGIPDVVTEQDAWLRAKRIAADMLDGKLWMPEVAKSTHYHAYWVRPSWVGEMKRILKLGVHTFYRPLNWGDGSDEPKWGDPKMTAEIAAKL
jgi:spore germination cell wall hydrolase CwlJ-like protein